MLSREIEYFLQVCIQRNIARAAAELGVSQPALTRAIQRLEAQLGAQLFIRTPRGVEPTAIGAALRQRGVSAQVILKDAEHEVAQMALAKVGRMRIGVGATVAHEVRQRLLPRLIAERPGAKVMFQVAFNAELFDSLVAGDLDFVVAGLPNAIPAGLSAQTMSEVEIVVTVRDGHPLTRLRTPTLADLAAYSSAAPRQDVYARKLVEQVLGAAHLPPLHVMVESNSWDTILATVASTDLYTLAPWYPHFEKAWAGRLQRIHIDQLHRRQPVGLIRREDSYVSPLAQRAMELILA